MNDLNESFKPGLQKMDGIAVGQFNDVYTAPSEHWVIKKVNTLADEMHADWVDYGQNGSAPPITWQRFTETVKKDADLLQDTKSGLKEFIPPFNLVWGQNEGKPTAYIVMKKVIGKELLAVDQWTDQMFQMVEDFITSCLNFYEESKKNSPDKTGYFPDVLEKTDANGLELKNILMGRMSDQVTDEQIRLYYIDTYPLFPILDDESLFFSELRTALKNFEVITNKKFSSDFWEILTTFYGPRNTAIKERILKTFKDAA